MTAMTTLVLIPYLQWLTATDAVVLAFVPLMLGMVAVATFACCDEDLWPPS